MAFGTNSGNAGQAALDKFAEMMIERMERMKLPTGRRAGLAARRALRDCRRMSADAIIPVPTLSSSNYITLTKVTTFRLPDLQAGTQSESACPQRRESLSGGLLGHDSQGQIRAED